MKKILIGGGILVAIVVIAVIVMVGNINPIVKNGVEKAAPLILKAPVTLNDVDISVFSGSGALRGFTVGNPAGYKTDYAFKMNELQVLLDVGSVTSDKIHIKSIVIDSPSIVFEGGFKKNNLTALQANAMAFSGGGTEKQETAEKSQGKKLQIDSIKINNGSISVSMGILQGKKLTLPLPSLELKDIGKDKDASVSDVLGDILEAINNAAIPAVQAGVANLGEGLKKMTEGAVQSGVTEGLGKIKGLFGK